MCVNVIILRFLYWTLKLSQQCSICLFIILLLPSIVFCIMNYSLRNRPEKLTGVLFFFKFDTSNTHTHDRSPSCLDTGTLIILFFRIHIIVFLVSIYKHYHRGRRSRECMVVGFTTSYAISAYHH